MVGFIIVALVIAAPICSFAKSADCERYLKAGAHITVVVNALTEYDKAKKLEALFGVPVRFVGGEVPVQPEKIPGTVIHIGPSRILARYVIGEKNPMVIREDLGIEDNKWVEYQMIAAVDSTTIPRSVNAVELIGKRKRGMDQIPSVGQVTGLVAEFFKKVEREFPTGAFIKHSLEAGTADEGKLIMTFKPRPAEIAASFEREISKVSQRQLNAALEAGEFAKETMDGFSSYTRLVVGLLLDPEKVFAQQRVEIQKTSDGYNKEIRVDFVAGRAVNAHNRWSQEYIPGDLAKAREFLNRFFKKAPPHMRALSGGADVIFLEDGSLVFMELNVGSQSAYMDARDLMIAGNLLISRLDGQDTPLIERLEAAHRSNIASKQAFLRGLTVRNTDGEYNKGPDDLHFLEALTYLRNRAIDDLPRSPSEAARQRVYDDIRALAASQSHRIRAKNVRMELEKFLDATGKSLELL